MQMFSACLCWIEKSLKIEKFVLELWHHCLVFLTNLLEQGNEFISSELKKWFILKNMLFFSLLLLILSLFRAKEIGCNNAETPDMFGHYREAKYTMTKHHWWWKVSHKSFSPQYLVLRPKYSIYCSLRLSYMYFNNYYNIDHHLVSSIIGRVPVCWMGGCRVKPQQDQHFGSSYN